MGHIRINSDKWDDVKKTWLVLESKTREGSTAVELKLRDSFGKEEHRVVASHQIEWLEGYDGF